MQNKEAIEKQRKELLRTIKLSTFFTFLLVVGMVSYFMGMFFESTIYDIVTLSFCFTNFIFIIFYEIQKRIQFRILVELILKNE